MFCRRLFDVRYSRAKVLPTLIVLLLFLGNGAFMARAEEAKSITIQSSDLLLTLIPVSHSEGQGLASGSLVDRVTQTSFLTNEQKPFFTIQVRKKGEKKEILLDSKSAWRHLEYKPTPGESGGILVFKDPVLLGDKPSITITVIIKAKNTEKEIHFSWSGETASSDFSLWRGELPLFSFRKFDKDISAFVPSLCGLVSKDVFTDKFKLRGIYPNGWSVAMAWIALWSESKAQGLFVAFEDPDAAIKVFRWSGNTKKESSDFAIDHVFENMGEPGNRFAPIGDLVLRTFKGNWFDAAIIYRNWVRKNATWYPKLGPEGRPDIPLWMKENCVFLMASSDDRWLTPNRRVYTPLNQMADKLHGFRDAVGVPGAVHWYLWHQNPYDNDYPHFFPAKEGFAEEVLKVQKDGDFRVMPYTNGRLWDTKDRGLEDWKFSKEGKQGAITHENGSILTETYRLPSTGKESDGSSCVHAAMCPGSAVWQKKVRENVLTAMNGHNVQCVYIDQVGAASPTPCFNRNHLHPLGGGDWWTKKGYWKIFKTIREDMRKEVSDFPLNPVLKKMVEKNPQILKDRIITTECNAEVYAASLDGFLTWHWQSPNQVPAFPVIYGGVIPMFGRCSTGDALSVKMRVCEALTFGEQIGWFDPSVKEDPEKFPFIRDAIRFRYQVKQYFYLGEMARAPQWKEPMPKTAANWLWGGQPNRNEKNSVQTSTWRILDYAKKKEGQEVLKSVLFIFSNVSNKEIVNRIQFDAKELGLDAGQKNKKLKVRRIDSNGITEENLSPSLLTEPLHFPPEKSWGLEIIL